MAIIYFVPTFLLPQKPRNEMPHRPLAQFYARHVQRPHDNESMSTELWQLVRPAERPSGSLCRWWARPGGVCGPQCDGDLPGFGFALPTGGMYPYGMGTNACRRWSKCE